MERPLSVLLFVIVMEVLGWVLVALVQHSFMAGFLLGDSCRGTLNISHLLFVDDTLFFCEAEHYQIWALRALLLCFEAVLSLRAKLNKSEIFLVGNAHNIRSPANILWCNVSYLPLKYLGLPLGAPSRVIITKWDMEIEKIERRLTGWKRLYLLKRWKDHLNPKYSF